ncbi:Multidrug resistance protein abc superfamily [Globisporangium polare]
MADPTAKQLQLGHDARDDQFYAKLESPSRHRNRLEVDFTVVDTPAGGSASASKQSSTTDGKIVTLLELLSYADRTDYALMALGTIGGLLAGMAEPLQIVLFGDVLNSFNPAAVTDSATMRSDINSVALSFVFLGVGVFVAGFVQVACWSISASRQAKRIRSEYVSAIITKEIGWFDVNEPMQLATRVADSTVTIQEGIGSKIGDALRFFSMAVSGIVIGFVKGWELTLVLLALTPFIAFSAYLSTKVLSTATQSGIESYGKAGAIAQESLSNIRTVHMFNSVGHFIKKYEDALGFSTTAGIKKGFAIGWGTGLMFFTMFCTYACGMFFGAWKIANDNLDGNTCAGSGCYDGGRVITVFFAVITSAMAMGQAGPSIQAIFSARAAAFDVFAVIKRASLIDPLSEQGAKLPNVTGAITIQDVTFAYPSRPEVMVCSNYNLTIQAGETVALVGPSGSGKSTIVSLLERFYDPLSGCVKLDGVDVRELNVKWLRAQVGLVGQEPALFATSIMENIRYGAPSATDAQVVEAAKMANAYNFIQDFPQGFATEVGERGTQLSGGQKQRIAIARAIIKNPPILLLDEATSALDTESERIVQESLDQLLATSKRTTIIVAHRLSTIRNADRIAVHSGGSIVEIGSHNELMRIQDGHYRMLVEAQSRTQDVEKRQVAEDMELVDSLAVVHGREEPFASSLSLSKRSLSKSSVHGKEDIEELDMDSGDVGGVALAPNVSMARLWRMSLPEWRFLLVGSLGAIVNASVYPVWGVMLSKMTVLFFQYQKTKHEMLVDARYWSLGFVGLGVAFGLSIIIQNLGFAIVSQRLVARVRLATFSAMLRQEVGWFDLDENASGALVARLATDSAILQAVTSDKLNQGLVNVTTLGIGVAISFYYSWQMTLALLASSPIMIFSSYMEAKQMSGAINSKKNNAADAAAGSLLAEAIGSIRTVASFSMEAAMNSAYVVFLGVSKSADIKTGVIAGASFGAAQGMIFLNLSFLFWLGGIWVSKGIVTFENMFVVLMVIMLSTFAVGMAAQNKTAGAKAKLAANRVFKIIDRAPEIDATSTAGVVLPRVNGDIEFRSLTFAYPSRPDAQIYADYSLKVSRGQTVALVGASGSGKSTAISLLERFYDPSSGVVTLDGTDLRELSLPWVREHISLVSQEPVLFAGTIAENIPMGKLGATREEVVEAAKKANAFDFICNFPHGLDTDVGDRGAQVSGGQKQRIAIARAILRDPEVLLLDEATSALDNESERVVQASLDRLLALKQRTTVIVAHRLSTIRNADLIAVTHDGAIVEQGTHDELMRLPQGAYKALVSRQMGSSP